MPHFPIVFFLGFFKKKGEKQFPALNIFMHLAALYIYIEPCTDDMTSFFSFILMMRIYQSRRDFRDITSAPVIPRHSLRHTSATIRKLLYTKEKKLNSYIRGSEIMFSLSFIFKIENQRRNGSVIISSKAEQQNYMKCLFLCCCCLFSSDDILSSWNRLKLTTGAG